MWFRLYTELLNDPKAQRLPGEQFKGWINILCLAKENGGLIPPIEDIAFKLRMSDADANCLVEELVRRELLDTDGKNTTPHNWHKRQFASDLSTERVRRFRNVSETSPETDTETEPESEQSREVVASPAKPRSASRRPKLCDENYIAELQANPAYAVFDVNIIYHKMVEWCRRKGKVPTQGRLLGWLNKEDRPLTAKGKPPKKPDVGATTLSAPVPTAEVNGFMDECIDDWIAHNDFIHLADEYDAIIKRGGAKAEWEIRCVAYYELHKQTTMEVL